MNKNVLHICYIEKFIPKFIDLVRNKIKTNDHKFLTMGSNYEKYPITKSQNVKFLSSRYLRYFTIVNEMNKTDKIMLHGLFDPGVIILLFLQPWLLKKCYWVMWGGDIYYKPKKGILNFIVEFCKNKVAKKIGYLVTFIYGDVKHVRDIYGAIGEYKYCIMYPSNCYKKYDIKLNVDSAINIQIGNSADPENEHGYIFEKLKNTTLKNIKIFAPLSYGDNNYAQKVSKLGFDIFGDKYIPMNDFMCTSKYTEWQSSIDLAIFAHKRQQGMGNVITLLGLGKTVYMRNNISSTLALESMGLKLGKIDEDEIMFFSNDDIKNNIKIIDEFFSENVLVEQLTKIFS